MMKRAAAARHIVAIVSPLSSLLANLLSSNFLVYPKKKGLGNIYDMMVIACPLYVIDAKVVLSMLTMLAGNAT